MVMDSLRIGSGRRRGQTGDGIDTTDATNASNTLCTANEIDATTNIVNVPDMSPYRPSRRPQSHYNRFQTVCLPNTDCAPSYATAIRQGYPVVATTGNETLSPYTCTVNAGARVLFRVENATAEDNAAATPDGMWHDIYLSVRGTMICLHKVSKGGEGKRFASYTLQHAEVGLATDSSYTVVRPLGFRAALVPTSLRHKYPEKYQEEPQTILRVRVEEHQFVFAHSSEECIVKLLNAMCEGIDIAPPIDERSIPKQCTVPRRRRRPRQQFSSELNSTAIVAEQERILQQMYPSFAREAAARETAEPLLSAIVPTAEDSATGSNPAPPAREEEEIDLSELREDAGDEMIRPPRSRTARPGFSRTTTNSSTQSGWEETGMLCAISPINFNTDGKWQPQSTRTEVQIQRYIRRCMPVLHAHSVRASQIVVIGGKRVFVNPRTYELESWELQPPTYKSHSFEISIGGTSETACPTPSLERTMSGASNTSARQAPLTPESSRFDLGGGDEITAAGMEAAGATADKEMIVLRTCPGQRQELKLQDVRGQRVENVHGVPICF